ncbi:MAG: circularly permuted type 2 ATP-grasp protein [Cyanophyceae cyanobacterium]
MQLADYDLADFYDEYFVAPGKSRPEVAAIARWLQTLSPQELVRHEEAAQQTLTELGATFIVDGTKRTLPFDILPRVIAASEWQQLQLGLKQRVKALNSFCADIYGEQRILRDGKVPREIIESATGFLPNCRGMKPPRGIWCHVSGIDLVRNQEGQWYVLEDNLRVPSGVAYALKNRQVLQSTLPQLVEQFTLEPVEYYAQQLLQSLLNSAPAGISEPTMAVLSPGPQETAYFEHAFLAESIGIALVEPEDLTIADGYLHRLTADGPQRIDIIYRRGDVDLLDALHLGDQYASGSSALIELCQQGRLTLANAMGTGVADDKVVYAYVPEIIRYYLGEEPRLPNVPTYLCWQSEDRNYVLEHLDQLVVKSASEYGGSGMLVGPSASQAERDSFADKIRSQPRNYIAQPTLSLSRIPTVVDGRLEGRHVDLRPYVVSRAEDIYVYPGGLTRVALEKGSLVVNSSRGGGTKDTWVLAE